MREEREQGVREEREQGVREEQGGGGDSEKCCTDFLFYPPDLIQNSFILIYLTVQSFCCNRSLISGVHR